VQHRLVDAAGEDAAHRLQHLVPRRAVGTVGVRRRLARQQLRAGHVASRGQHPEVVQVLETERLTLGHVEQRGAADRVGGQPVRLGPQFQPQAVREGTQRQQVMLMVKVGQHLIEVVAHVGGGVRVERVQIFAPLLQHDGQKGKQVIAGPPGELGDQGGRPQRRVGLQLEGVLEQVAAGLAQQPPDATGQHRAVPHVDDRLRAGRAEMVDDVGGRHGMRTALGLLARAAHPVGEQQPRPVRHGHLDPPAGRRHHPHGSRIEHAGGDQPGNLHGEHARLDGGGDAAGERGRGVHQFLGGGRVLRGDGRHRGGPARADREVHGEPPRLRPAQRGLHRGEPGRGAPAVPGGVKILPDTVVHILDLHTTETGVGDLVDLPGDLRRIDQPVRPPPPELRPGVIGGGPAGPGRHGGPGGARRSRPARGSCGASSDHRRHRGHGSGGGMDDECAAQGGSYGVKSFHCLCNHGPRRD